MANDWTGSRGRRQKRDKAPVDFLALVTKVRGLFECGILGAASQTILDWWLRLLTVGRVLVATVSVAAASVVVVVAGVVVEDVVVCDDVVFAHGSGVSVAREFGSSDTVPRVNITGSSVSKLGGVDFSTTTCFTSDGIAEAGAAGAGFSGL